MMSTPGRWTGFRMAELAILTAFSVFLLRNALAYPFIAGIDACLLYTSPSPRD